MDGRSSNGPSLRTGLKREIDALLDPYFRAEVSVLKSLDETYGTKDSVRIDVLENLRNGTVCIYDIKTGRSRLGKRRARELVSKVAASFEGAHRMIVIEVTPTR